MPAGSAVPACLISRRVFPARPGRHAFCAAVRRRAVWQRTLQHL